MVISKNWSHHFFVYGIFLLGHHTLKENDALKEANYTKLAHKEENDQELDFKERMDQKILKLATIKSSTYLNMHQIIG